LPEVKQRFKIYEIDASFGDGRIDAFQSIFGALQVFLPLGIW
jgi:hypothetical protein